MTKEGARARFSGGTRILKQGVRDAVFGGTKVIEKSFKKFGV